ncbi:unnamed protein product [Parnassius mnemosyne]
MTQHNSVIDQLVRNQQSINATLELLLNSTAYKENSLIKYAHFAQLLTIITENVNDLLGELVRIENMLALVRALSTHHSMIDIDSLRLMIERVRMIYGDDRILNLDLRDYYSIIKPGSYYVEKQIVIVFKVPIVSANVFDLYKLSIAPNRYNKILIPPLPFLATNREAYAYMEAECPKVDQQYLCEDDAINRVKNHHDCTRDLVTNHALGDDCNLTTITLEKEAMEQLDAGNYVVTFPRTTTIYLRCGREEYKQLQGSYLVTIPLNCTLMTSEFTIVNENNQVSGQPLIITDIPRNFKEETTPQHRISLQSIDLRKLHEAYSQVMREPIMVQDTIASNTLYHTTIPVYVMIIGSLIITAIVMICRRFNLWRRSKPQQQSSQLPAPGKHSYEDPKNAKAYPATFSLKVGK